MLVPRVEPATENPNAVRLNSGEIDTRLDSHSRIESQKKKKIRLKEKENKVAGDLIQLVHA